ncbi:5-deoxy-glucuronate isomerase [Cohaesibacter haloalkalitolerans]|uniref:5-deoxy-glucuronate isomerase n=1 Tax=Cohaesibacter haloalkalitolerans TaxID=1162980 RepID=UPI000E64BF6F|nr:5-deoxy-glucuronate isomerase [Cohaesibacter haloalkalitolerans]
MSRLLCKPTGSSGRIHDITPESAGWKYVGFALHVLKEGDKVSELTGDREAILVMIEGWADISSGCQSFGTVGSRSSVFDPIPPQSVYIPNDSQWEVVARGDCTLAVCTAPGHGGHAARLLDSPKRESRGKGANTRHIYSIAMEDADVADSLLVTEVITPSGNWSSYPPHRHDEDDFPNMTYLEETYYHRLNPSQGYAHQRVFTDDGSLDETVSFTNHDLVLVPKGYHPCGAPYGYDLYYLNVMAGPRRNWRFRNHPDHDWIAKRDA